MVAKAHPPSSSESDDWGDEGWIVDCPCGINYDDGEKMVECDECGVWVHTACCRVVKDQETFNCDKCKSKKRKEDEESEVAQLLVDLPSKTLSFEDRGHDRAAVAHSDTLCAPLAADNGDRAHVHGVPGGDPRLFFAGSIFSQQLWKYAGYVRKPLRIDFDDLPVESGEHDIFQLLDDPLTDELALVVTLDSSRLEQSRGEAKLSIEDSARETHNGELPAPKDKIVKTDAKTEIKRVERSGKHKLKLKLKHRHKPHKEGKPRHHDKRTRDDAGGVPGQVHKKKQKINGGDAAKAGDERSKKVEGLFRHANVSPTNLEGSVQEVQTSVKKAEGSPQATKSKREGFSSDASLSFKSPQSSPKNPKTMKKLAVQEFMDGGITICSRCSREDPILGYPVTFSGSKPENKVCRECGRYSEKVQKSNPCEYSDPVHSLSHDVKCFEATGVGDEPGSDGKHATDAGAVLAPDIGDRKIDGESLRTDSSQRTSAVDTNDNHINGSRRHGVLRSSEKSEPRAVAHAPGGVEQHVSAIDVKAGALLEAAFRETGGKGGHFDKEQKTSHQDVSEFHRPVNPTEAAKGHVAGSPSARPKDKEALTAGGSKVCRHSFKAGTCNDNVVHPQIKPSASIAPIKVESSMENYDLGLKSEDKLAFQHSAASGNGEMAGSLTASRALASGIAGAAANGDRQMPIDRISGQDASLGPGHQAHNTSVLSSEMLLQLRTTEGAVDVTSDKSLLSKPPSSLSDGRDGRAISQLAAGIRDKVVGRTGISRSNSATSHQDSAQVCQLSLDQKVNEPVVTEQILQSISTGPNEESLLVVKQQTYDLHHQSGSKHVHKKHQDLHGSTCLQRIEMEHTAVLRQQDQAEAVESSPSPRQTEHSPSVDFVDHKTSPLQSPLCQQARQHHLHSSRGRAGAGSSPALGGSSRNCSPAAGGASKSTTPVGSRSSGGSSSVSPKSPPVPLQFSKHVGGRSPPPQRPSVNVVKTPHGSSKQSSAPAFNSKHHPSPAKISLVSSSSLPVKTSSIKQPSRTASLPSLKGVDNTLPPKSPGAAVPASVRSSGLGLSSAGPSGKSSSLSKAVFAGKSGGATRHVVSSKVSNSQAVVKQSSAQLSVRLHPSLASEPHKSGLQPGKHPLATVPKQGSAGSIPREDKSPVPSASGMKGALMSTMPPPPPPGSLKRSPPAGPAVTLKDEEVAMLLHQELNSSPRVPRVPRARLTNAGIQGVSANQPLVGPAKRLLSGAIQSASQSVNRDVGPRKRLRDDRHREVGRTSSSPVDEISKAGGTIRKHEDGGRADDGHHHPVATTGHVEIGNLKEKLSYVDSARRPCHGFPRSSLSIVVPARSDDSSDQCDKKSPADGTILTLPGLIDDILSNTEQQLEYEDVCEAVWPYWQKLRKPNGERYAYASHRQAVLDCLRNRSAWSHLVDRGPKTNLGRKRRRTDIALSAESDEDEDTDGAEQVHTEDSELIKIARRGREPDNEKLHLEHVERSRVISVALPEDVPKGKRKARSRRRRPLATEGGKAQSNGNSSRAKSGASELKSASDRGIGEEEPDAPSSPSSEDAVSNYSEEDEEMVVHKGMRSSRRRRDGESSEGEDEIG